MANSAGRISGATLLELLAAITIIAILVVVAYSSYNRIKNESRRADAQAGVIRVESVVESYLAQNNQSLFGSSDLSMTQFANYSSSSSTPVLTNSGYYVLTIVPDSSGYSVIATALDSSGVTCSLSSNPTTGQCADTLCWTISLNHGAKQSTDSTGTVYNAATTQCW